MGLLKYETSRVDGLLGEWYLSECLRAALPRFFECVQNVPLLKPVPFFAYVFNRPSPFLVDSLRKIRLRNGLRPEDDSTTPGLTGLRSNGYYVLALHFRAMPIGFEPMATVIKSRAAELESYWQRAESYAEKAASIAACRKLELLLYFATDDAANLRPHATARLARFGKVVFGLEEHEVGHIKANWGQRDLVDAVKAFEDPSFAQDLGRSVNKGHLKVVRPLVSETEVEHGANMALVEWWILAQSHWLFSSGGTYYSSTAAPLGLGPLGAMERYNSNDNNHAVWRRDWEGDACKEVRSANKNEDAACLIE